MRKKILGAILCLCLGGIVAGCGDADSGRTSVEAEGSASKVEETVEVTPEPTLEPTPEPASGSFVQKGTEIDGGEWNGLSWLFTDAGELVVTGHMEDPCSEEGYRMGAKEWNFYSAAPPWMNYRNEITSAYLAFSGAESLNKLFKGWSKLQEVDLSNLDTGNVTSMQGMFNECSSLTGLDLSSFDTSNVTNMENMFNGCSSLTSLDLSSFDTSNVTNMCDMFNECSSLTSLDLSSFDTSNVTNMNQCH